MSTKRSSKYQHGKIYKIYSSVSSLKGQCYVGSTIKENLNDRWSEHKSELNRSDKEDFPLYQIMAKHGIEKFKIKLLQAYPCASNKQLHDKEREWYEKLQPKWNKQVPSRTAAEWKAEQRHIK